MFRQKGNSGKSDLWKLFMPSPKIIRKDPIPLERFISDIYGCLCGFKEMLLTFSEK